MFVSPNNKKRGEKRERKGERKEEREEREGGRRRGRETREGKQLETTPSSNFQSSYLKMIHQYQYSILTMQKDQTPNGNE